MRLTQSLALVSATLLLTGCRARPVVAPESPMPPNTILLSQMLRQLSAQPGFTQDLLHELEGNKSTTGKKGPALLTPKLIDELRKRILGKDWQGLDRFPGWTMREINPTVRLVDRLAGRNQNLEAASAVHPGAPISDQQSRTFLDIGPYPLDKTQTIDLNQPSTLPPFTTAGIVTPLGMGVTRGDGPNSLAPEHAASQRLADVLNRLAANRLDGAGIFKVMRPWPAIIARRPPGPPMLYKPNPFTTTPEDLIFDLQATGHTVTVTDTRYFANFGHLHYRPTPDAQPEDVMMPFWINTRLPIPGTAGLFHRARPLLIPVSHAELEFHIRGPQVNADVSHYFGVDGKAEWRTMDTLDQAWVLKRNAHTYTGPQALQATRLLALITLAYMHQHGRRPNLPFGGYYTLGVCQDVVSAVEIALTGSSTLFPNTVDAKLFNDPRDPEVNALFARIPHDRDTPRDGDAPPPSRVFGSLPTLPGPGNRFPAITIPGLAPDLQTTYTAWQSGQRHHLPTRSLFALAALAALALLTLIRRHRNQIPT